MLIKTIEDKNKALHKKLVKTESKRNKLLVESFNLDQKMIKQKHEKFMDDLLSVQPINPKAGTIFAFKKDEQKNLKKLLKSRKNANKKP